VSRRWGYLCRTCGTESDYIFNNGQDRLREAFALREEIRAIRKSLYLEVEMLGDYGGAVMYLTHHADHDLCLESEYGDREELK
jgi:hypothetical protein